MSKLMMTNSKVTCMLVDVRMNGFESKIQMILFNFNTKVKGLEFLYFFGPFFSVCTFYG